ncbi:histidine kinase [Natronococcus pandeyae]|uniref:histidine kinase n=1 Tax=Natronococcus pandeyae TaxID=2055836 RepID=A0A8J8Q3R8_9EURY|nr:ATP-binding protein [Natronococcus pandeyae]TYL36570.1 histidine kinase [Natronococcus pandeyae]
MPSNRFRNTVDQVGNLVSSLDTCDSIDDVYDHAVVAVEDLIEFDTAIICTAENGQLEPRAANVDQLVPADPLATGDGIAGKTLEEERTIVVDDLETEPAAVPASESFRSVLSIPFGHDGVIQLHSRERGAFSAVDRQLGELLASIVTNVRGRITYEEELGRQRDRFAALFENVPDAALQYRIEDGTQLVDAVNSSFIRTFGYGATEVVDEPIEKLFVPDDEDTMPELRYTTDAGRQTDVEVVRETASGPRPFLLRNVPVATGDGTTRGYLIYTDLTELKERERELERKNERLDRFASIVSHDLRNPLNVANGYLELAMDHRSSTELEKIERAHDRMDRLIDDVLALAREGETDGFERVSVDATAREAWQNVSTERATLEVDADRSIEADRGRLLQLFENLFRNSVEHGSTSSRSQTDDALEHAGSDIHLRVESLPNGFAVADDGPGIPPGEREAVFEPGYTSEGENTGLGLVIVSQISEAHGWTVNLTTGETGGARFEFIDRSSGEETLEGNDGVTEGRR